MPKRKAATKSRRSSTPAQRARKRRTIITKVTTKSTETRSNPSRAVTPGDFGSFVLPAAVAFLGTKALMRVVFSLVGKRYPKFAAWAAVLAGAGVTGLAYALAHKNKHTAKYQDVIVLGGSIATVHTAAVQILPLKYNWLIGDLKQTDLRQLPPVTPSSSADPTATAGDEYSYLEDDAPQTTTPKKAAAAVAAAAGGKESQFDQDLAQYLEEGESVDDLSTGVFSN